MALKKAFETTKKNAYAALFYGQTGVGKSTLACSADKAIIVDFDGGLERVAIQHRKDYSAVTNWQEAVADTQQAIASGYTTVVVDTVGKMIDCIEADIKANNPAMVDKRGGLTLKGFGLRKIMFSNYLNSLKSSGVNVVFVAQETETEEDGRKIRRPAVGSDKMATELLQDIDIAGYIHVVNGKRTVEFGTVDYAWTKNSCGLPASVILADLSNGAENNALQNVSKQFDAWQSEKCEKASEYADICKQIDEICGGIENVDNLNMAVQEVCDLPEVLTSKLYARQAIKVAAEKIGAKLDKTTKQYV